MTRRMIAHPLAETADLLETAARIARGIVEGEQAPDRIDSVAWRAADALWLLREFSDREFPDCPTPGIHEGTGLGAKLAVPPKRTRGGRARP